MLKSSTYSAIWILILFFDLAVSENKSYPKRNSSLLNLRGEKSIHTVQRFWRRKLLHNRTIETTGSLNEISQSKNDQTIRNKNYKRESKNDMGSIIKTLVAYNGPVIMEDLDNKNDRDFMSHIRVKRNEPTNYSIIRLQSNSSKNLIDSFPLNFWSEFDAMNASGNLMSKSRGLSVDLDNENQTDILRGTDISHSRHKRDALYKNGKHKRRMRGNVRHSKHHFQTINGNKEHDVLKSSHKSVMKKSNNYRKENKKTREIDMPFGTIDKSQMESKVEKRELGNNPNTDIATNYKKVDALTDEEDNALLSNNRNSDEQRIRNVVASPFMNAEKAELRVRIEKMPTNASTFLNSNDRNRTIELLPSTTLAKYGTGDEIFDANVTNLKFTPNLNSIARKEVNLSMEIILKKLNYRNNVSSNLKKNDSDNASFLNEESRPIKSNLPGVKDDRDEKYELSDEDTKSRAKRNQEIASKRHLRSDRNAIGSKHFKDIGQRTSIEGTKHGNRKHRRARSNRAVRSVEEIKELAEKLIIKINELQIYVSNRNETRHTTESCLIEDADPVAIEEASGLSLGRKGISSSRSKIAENVDNRRRFAKNSEEQTTSIGKRASQMSSGGSRFSRKNSRMRKSRRKWGRWMDWSSCSVTCGKGRQIRWRHCLRDCDDAETEMEEKTCQLPACPPGKFLGIF